MNIEDINKLRELITRLPEVLQIEYYTGTVSQDIDLILDKEEKTITEQKVCGTEFMTGFKEQLIADGMIY